MCRIGFEKAGDRNKFFSEIKSNCCLSWEKLALEMGTTRTVLDTYRFGKILLPQERFDFLLRFILPEKHALFRKKTFVKDRNWGAVLGGKTTYRKHKWIYALGREKVRLKPGGGVKYDFDINQPLSEELCEFVGVVIGDGCTNKSQHHYYVLITGDKVLDNDYYFRVLKPICQKIFRIEPRIIFRSCGINLHICSKRVFELLTQRFEIPAGVKCYAVKIPQEILDAPEHMLRATLRGMFNTDGGVGFDKRKVYVKPYVRVNYTSASPKLIEQLHEILENFGIPHSIHLRPEGRAQQIQINGEKNVMLFLGKIGFSNLRHLEKVKYLLPRSIEVTE